MNKTYRLVWSKARQAWIVAPEFAAGRGKKSRLVQSSVAALAGALASFGVAAQVPAPGTLPTGGQVTAGQASVSQSGNAMTVHQGSAKAILNWNSFSIGSQASVTFKQPSSSAVALNRVSGSDPSAIYGTLSANGQVFLINPSGVVFGPSARVDVGGLVASTLDIGNTDFLAGNYRFNRNGATGSVINRGELLGKYVALLAPEVRNEGVIVAKQGTAALAAGDAVTLGISGSNLVGIQVDKASIATLVENRHLIQADEGTVVMSAQSANGLVGKVVNSGTVEAKGITTDGGVVRLVASSAIDHSGSIKADAGLNGNGGDVIVIADLSSPNSSTSISGTISAKGGSESGNGGFVETSASKLKMTDSARVDTSASEGLVGDWLLDPYDFTIAASNGDITGATLGAALASNNVTIQTTDTAVSCTDATCGTGNSSGNGDIFVNDSVTWASNRKLTLSAWRNVHINAPINVNGAGGSLALEFAQSGTEFDFPSGVYTVSAPVNLAAGTGFSTKAASDGAVINYTVINDATALANISGNLAGNYVLGNDVAAPGTSWAPLGSTATPFTGIFDGLGHKVTGLQHTNAGSDVDVGLFGGSTGLLQNVGVTGVNIAGSQNVGALVGYNNGFVVNSYATGTVTGSGAGNVGRIGGLVGFSMGPIQGSYADVAVSATSGNQTGDPLADGRGGIGGLAGVVGTSVSDSYARGSVNGGNAVGGLVGYSGASISSSYSSGAVTGTTNVAGFVGEVMDPGGFMPFIFNSFWNTETSGQATGGGGMADSVTGLDTAGMATASNFTNAGWDTANAWELRDGQNPLLKQMLQPIFVTADNITTTYNGSAFTAFTNTIGPTGTPGGAYTGTVTYTPSTANPTNAGTYTVTPGGVSVTGPADQHGYRVQFVDGTLTIDPAVLTTTITGSLVGSIFKEYDGTSTATGLTNANFSLSGWAVGEGASVTKTTGTFTDGPNASASTTREVTVTLALSDYVATGSTNFANYTLPTSVSGNIGEIRPKALTVTGTTAAGKVYDGSTTAAITAGSLSGFVGTETVTATATGTFDSKNAGSRTATASYTLANGSNGGLATNYSLANTTGHAATITPKTLSVTGTTAAGKVYDGTTAAAITAGTLSGFVGSETVTATATGTFDSKDAGNRSATATYTLAAGDNGGLASNYSLADTSGHAATIAQKTLSVSGTTAAGKVYDGTTAAAITAGTLSGFVGAETVTATATGTFDSKNAGNRSATATYTLAAGNNGGLASNYSLANTTGHTATITQKALTVTGTTAASKVYDGTTTAAITAGTLSGFVDSETVTATATGTFDSKNAGSHTATATYTLADDTGLAANYSLASTTGHAATITPKALALLDLSFAATPTNANATSIAINDTALITTASVPSSAIIAGDTVSAVFSPNTNAEKTITALSATPLGGPSFDVTANRPAALTLAGPDAGNYTLTGATMKARVTAASAANTTANTTVAAVVNSGPAQPTTTAGPTPTTASPQRNAEPKSPTPSTTTTTAAPPAQISGRTSNPTPLPGQTVPITVEQVSSESALDASKPVAAVLVPASGDEDLPMPTPKITVNANGTLSIEVTVPPGTPPGVYFIAVAGTDANGRSRAVIVPVVVRRTVSAA